MWPAPQDFSGRPDAPAVADRLEERHEPAQIQRLRRREDPRRRAPAQSADALDAEQRRAAVDVGTPDLAAGDPSIRPGRLRHDGEARGPALVFGRTLG